MKKESKERKNLPKGKIRLLENRKEYEFWRRYYNGTENTPDGK